MIIFDARPASVTVALYLRPQPASPILRYSVVPSNQAVIAIGRPPALAISPDGRHVAFVAIGADAKVLLWVRSLDALESEPLPGTEGAVSPFWSPDSRYLAFFSGGKLKKIQLPGGRPEAICDSALLTQSGTWGPGGTILFSQGTNGPIARVNAAGGPIVPVTTIDKAAGEIEHIWPQFLPDGRHFFYLALTDRPEKPVVAQIGSLDSAEHTALFQTDSKVMYAAPGYILFLRDGNLLMQGFDSKRRQLIRDPATLAHPVRYGLGAAAAFDASSNGILDPARLEAGIPHALFDARVIPTYNVDQYGVTLDGQQFLIRDVPRGAKEITVTVVVNWTAALNKK